MGVAATVGAGVGTAIAVGTGVGAGGGAAGTGVAVGVGGTGVGVGGTGVGVGGTGVGVGGTGVGVGGTGVGVGGTGVGRGRYRCRSGRYRCRLRRGCRCRGRGRNWRRLGGRNDYYRHGAGEHHFRHLVRAIAVGVGNSRPQVLTLVRCFRCVRRRSGGFNGTPSHLVLGALPLPTDAGHAPIGVHDGGHKFAAELGGFGRDVDHPLFVNVGDPDADGDVVEPPAVVHGSGADGVGALGLEVEVCALGHREVDRWTC